MGKPNTVVLLVGVALAFCSSEAAAQLFGQRNLGRPLSRRSSLSSQSSRSSSQRQQGSSRQTQRRAGIGSRIGESLFENIGTLDEGARYLRGNRRATDFVGADASETQGFVGRQQAGATEETTEIRSAIEESEIPQVEAPDVNRQAQPAMPARAALYPPRLRLGFARPAARPADLPQKLQGRLAAALASGGSSRIAVSVEGGVAILRGTVPSEHQRRLAALLVRFEPGISEVRNELAVQPAGSGRPAALRPPRPGGS